MFLTCLLNGKESEWQDVLLMHFLYLGLKLWLLVSQDSDGLPEGIPWPNIFSPLSIVGNLGEPRLLCTSMMFWVFHTLLQSTSTLPLRNYPPCQFLSREWWLTRLSGGETLVPDSLWSLVLKISWWMGLPLSSDCLLEPGWEEGTSLNSVNEMPGDWVFPALNCWILGSLRMCRGFHPRERLL